MTDRSYEATRWSLDDLLPSTAGSEFQDLLQELEEAVSTLEASRDQLSPDLSPEAFGGLVELVESIYAISSRLRAYAYLWYSEDTQDEEALAFRGRIEQLLTDVQNRTLFFSLWWKGLNDEAAERLQPAGGDNAYYLESLRRFKPHTLSEPEERVINLKDVNGVSGLVTVYEMITTAFTFQLEVDGEIKQLTRAELETYWFDARPEVRAAAYQALYQVYSQQAPVLSQIYQYVARDWANENLKLRSFSSPISVRNLHNDLPDAVVNTLLEVCRQNASVLQRYFRLKAGWLRVERLRRYDVYAPLSTSDERYPFGQAADMVLDSLHHFSPVIADHARRILDESHVDAEIRPRKDTGAFCAGVLPGLTPWMLMNYTGQISDVATLAHELGHGIHALMAAEHTPLTFHSSLPLAETASVFCEMLLLEHLLAQEPDPAVRRELLAGFVDRAWRAIIRQAYFVLFEREAHELIAAGETGGILAQRYLANLEDQFGDALEMSDEFRWEWVTIPHIYHTPFYCYAYSFGQLLVLALYRQYEQEGQDFVPRYLKILGYGGAKAPVEILEEAGIDVASSAFWQGGFDVIADLIRQLEEVSA